MHYKIWVTGDPVRDCFLEGKYNIHTKRFEVQETYERPGGAHNTFSNLCSILRDSRDIVAKLGFISDIEPRELIRLVDIDSKNILVEFWNNYGDRDLEDTYVSVFPFQQIGSEYNDLLPGGGQALVISEYNKGTCSVRKRKTNPYYLKRDLRGQRFDFCIIDSRYRTLEPEILEFCDVAIWHATGGEFDEAWAQYFDYVLWTNGAKEVWLGPVNNSSGWCTVAVPNTPVVDTIGAGDTFTAAVAAHLAQRPKDIDMSILEEATVFAIDCCQEVIRARYTATTTKKLPV